MACPWKFLFKTKFHQYTMTGGKDINNNMEKAACATSSLVTQDDLQYHSLSKQQNESPQPLVGTGKKSPESLVKPDATPLSSPRHVRIKNWGSGMTFQDTLHHKAKGILTCRSKSCLGSIMTPKSLTRGPRDKPTPPDELLPQAIEFVNQYYGSFKEAKIEEHLARVEAVTKEIETTGTYQLTGDELIFATKQAWRNAPRCIGRIQWSNLQVFDARNCSTAREMFEHICRHVRYSTNNGNIRSAITVFPQRSDGKHDFRVWNAQLIRYAGYQMPDGSIRGDPANAPVNCVCLFAIYEWFRELTKWPTCCSRGGRPGVPRCPFNGWYMGTEIGVRTSGMGLETHSWASLWERPAPHHWAVIHSFGNKQNVTIMDHHSAAESFMKYMQNEYRSRGGCPADWIWLVPPMSGSITPVFHQEMLNYVLSPFYYYQADLAHSTCLSICPHRAVLFACMLMRKTMASRVRVTILFATETGKSEALAWDLGALFSCAFNPKVVCMDKYSLSCLEEERLLLVVTSTFGNGDCPGNGEKLKKSLFMLKELTNKFRYAVFGLGSSMYPRFCAFAHDIDQKLSHLGASQLTPMGEGDELSGQEDAFRSWAVQTFKAACETFDVRGKQHIQIPKLYTSSVTWDPHHYRLVQDSQPLDLSKALSNVHAKNVFTMRLKSRQNLQSLTSSRATILVELSCEDGQGLNYLPGEHLGVCPGNQPALVQGILERVVDGPAPHQTVRLEALDESGSYWVSDKRLPPCSLSQALTYFLDITTPPTQLLLQKLAQVATEATERQRLEALCQYTKWKFTNSPTFLEVLEEFPSLWVSTGFLLSRLPILKPRFYSMSSSLDHTPTKIHLTVAVVMSHTRGDVCVGLGCLRAGPSSPVLFSASGFHLPEDPSHPCILVGPGTGIAPFRSFWQQRLHDSQHKGVRGGRMTLVFGCRRPDEDHIYQEEMLEMAQKGVLHAVHTAYSRLPGKPKVYVQDILRQQLASEVLRVLHEELGHLYVCGDVRMAWDVAHTLKQLVAAKLNLNEEQVEDYFFQLK
uniref:Nitric oxide synthase, inducible n=1 Tax=Macaca nemestrina TaxID=9545 RepID=A0A2K6BPD6_MACNE